MKYKIIPILFLILNMQINQTVYGQDKYCLSFSSQFSQVSKYNSYAEWFACCPTDSYYRRKVIVDPADVLPYFPPEGAPEDEDLTETHSQGMTFYIGDKADDLVLFARQVMIQFVALDYPYEISVSLHMQVRRLIITVGHKENTIQNLEDVPHSFRWIGHTHPALEHHPEKAQNDSSLYTSQYLNNGLGLVFSKEDILCFLEYAFEMFKKKRGNRRLSHLIPNSDINTTIVSKYGIVLLSLDIDKIKTITKEKNELDAIEKIFSSIDNDEKNFFVEPNRMEEYGLNIRVQPFKGISESIVKYLLKRTYFQYYIPYVFFEDTFVSETMTKQLNELHLNSV